MGSTGDNYKCPLCGRRGPGYSHDAIGYAICKEGDYSCFWFHFIEGGEWPKDMLQKALQKVMIHTPVAKEDWVANIVLQFFFSREKLMTQSHHCGELDACSDHKMLLDHGNS